MIQLDLLLVMERGSLELVVLPLVVEVNILDLLLLLLVEGNTLLVLMKVNELELG